MLSMCRHNCAARGLDPGYSTPTWSMFTNPGAFAAVMIPAGSFALVTDRERATVPVGNSWKPRPGGG
jgi:hypothetical protein